MKYQPIENYGIIGDLSTVALVGMNGSIDFFCYPHFDSPSVFAALLDAEKGGSFQIAPAGDGARQKQLYMPGSNVLLTRFLFQQGVVEIADFMPIQSSWPGRRIVRQVRCVRGSVRIRMRCAPRFDYARAKHRLELRDGQAIFVSEGADRLALRLLAAVPLKAVAGDALAEFTLEPGDTTAFVLEEALSADSAFSVDPRVIHESYTETLVYWHNWLAKSTYRGRWREIVDRSALVLKLLTSARHGSMVAAPTFGFPEAVGGGRNWDYRYTWIRDSAFALYALMRLGYTEEARAFFRWLDGVSRQPGEDEPLQIAYRLDGRREIAETVLDHFEGYRKSAPVRVGNAAYGQLQLDIYGELADAIYIYDKYGAPITYDGWQRLARITDWVCDHWHLPDEGIWEVRGGRKEFLFSRLMCWVALDRALRLAAKRNFPGPLERWDKVRGLIREDILTHFWNRDLEAFVQYKGATAVDASSLLMPLVKFVSPNAKEWFFTLRRIEDVLVEDSLVFRYDPDRAAADGLAGGEGTFSMCSFWYVECVTRAGDLDKARLLFEKALSYSNHLGLYSEELGCCGEHLGNFPQALTHLALISAAFDLDRRLSEQKRV